jgi:hypothetical protein
MLTPVVAAVAAVLLTASPASAAYAMQLGRIQYDSPGSDNRTNASLNAEYVTVTNHASGSRNLRGWTLRDLQSHVYTFPNITVGGGRSVVVHTGHGTNTSTNLYWGSGNYIWNNTGDRATLRDAQGHQIDSCSWTGDSGATKC